MGPGVVSAVVINAPDESDSLTAITDSNIRCTIDSAKASSFVLPGVRTEVLALAGST